MAPLFFGGLVLALLGIVAAMLVDGNALGPLVSMSSFLLVFVGTMGAGMMSYRLSELPAIARSLGRVVRSEVPDLQEMITLLGRLADTARRDGMLALEARLEEVDDRFVATGVQLLVDGVDEEVVQETLDIEIAALDERHQTAIGFFKALGGYAPTFGMVGTVIALVNMLGNLTDPSQLGQGMSMALITTLYGVLLANLVFIPVANRLERLNRQELAVLDVVLDGLLTVRRGASPREVIERLESYLPHAQRQGVGDRLVPVEETTATAGLAGKAA